MIELQIAGAGAGKTFGLASRIVEKHSHGDSHKIVYAITYTNSAKRKIVEEIVKLNGYIPDYIRVETVHSFFLSEIIYPYSPYLLSEVFTLSATTKLPPEPRFKNYKLKLLREKGIIHSEEVFKKAKIIVDRSNSKHGNKAKREKVDFVLSHIASKIGHVYVDEVQDLDGDALEVFKILGSNGIKVHLLGDPKQALKFPDAFRSFLKDCKGEIYAHLENNNSTRRVPTELLKLSNMFCREEECQTSSSAIVGKINYITSLNAKYDRVLEYYAREGKLLYIEQKDGDYATHKPKNFSLPLAIEDKVKAKAKLFGLDENLFVASIVSELMELLSAQNPRTCINAFCRSYDISLEKNEFAEFITMLTDLERPSGIKHVMASIEAVKGLESDVCIFVLNQTMYNYLVQNINEDQYYNKNWNKVYVALTRSSNQLIFAVDESLFTTSKLPEIVNYFQSKSITELQVDFLD